MEIKHLYKDEIKKILILFCMTFILISIVLLYIFLGVYTKGTVKAKNKDYNDFTYSVLYEELKSYENIINKFEENEIISDYLLTGNDQSKVYESLYDFINKSKIKSVFYLVDTEGKTILTSNYVESPYNSYDIFISGLFKQLKNNSNEIVFMNNKIQIDLTKRTIYSIGKAVIVNGEIEGYLVFDILEADLKNAIYNQDTEILIITDQYNNAIISTNSIFLDDIGKFNFKTSLQDNNYTATMFDRKFFYSISELFNGKLRIYTLSEISWINKLLTMTISYAIMIMLILFAMIIFTADYISSKKTKSITLLIDSITRVQNGDLKAYVPINTGDEFQLIGEQFNKMLKRLDGLSEKNSELINRNRLAEIKQLESQFNPHFIFNTLETLKYMIAVDKDKAVEIIVSLARILRYSIEYEKKTISVGEDIIYLNNYLSIQKFRYNNRLTYDIKIDELAKVRIVPKLILQPLIENCINHGYKSKENLHIILDIEIIEDHLVMTVIDNGEGIEINRLNKIIDLLDHDGVESNSIGLTNVHRRLKLLYGDEYGLKINSEIGKGTLITIRIPNNYI